jgi:hypothetical protein
VLGYECGMLSCKEHHHECTTGLLLSCNVILQQRQGCELWHGGAPSGVAGGKAPGRWCRRGALLGVKSPENRVPRPPVGLEQHIALVLIVG